MERRAVGLLLIGLVLVAAVVVHGLGARLIPGSAQATPVSGPPAVGDCLTAPLDPSWNDSGSSLAPVGNTTGTYSYPVVPMAACRGNRYGEVVAVISNPGKPVVTYSNDGSTTSVSVDDSNLELCYPAASRYVGLPMAGAQQAPILKFWYPNLMIGSGISAPSTRQQAAGQHWLACVLYLPPTGVADQSVVDKKPYDGTLENALLTGRARDRLGWCLSGPDLSIDEGDLSCYLAHAGQVFATGTTDAQPVSRATLLASCRSVAVQLSGMPDITAGGALAPALVTTDTTGKKFDAAQVPPYSNLTCGITSKSHRRLTGSLLGLGDDPIPWA